MPHYEITFTGSVEGQKTVQRYELESDEVALAHAKASIDEGYTLTSVENTDAGEFLPLEEPAKGKKG